MREKFRKIEEELNTIFFERKEEIRGLMVGLLSRQHVLLLGPPGTGKSAMSEELCSRIFGGQYFRWLLSRTTAPEELFGPISLKALEQDSYRRITNGKLPEANVVFLDEIFKCNSAVLNSLLTVLNERLFFNDGQPVQVPLEMAVGASNELPEDREELSALWDRFLLRYIVGYLKEEQAFVRMLEGAISQHPKTTVSYEELKAAQQEVEKVDVSPVLFTVAMLRRKMAEMNISVSDRRWKMALSAVKANAWLEGKDKADEEDLEVLVHILWQDPEHRLQVRQEVMAIVNPVGQKLQDLIDQATEIYQNALKDAETDKAASKGTEAVAKLKKITKELSSLEQELATGGKSTAKVKAAVETVKKYNKEVASKCLGIEL